MAHLTIEVPDDLALNLESVKERIVDILRWGYRAVVGEHHTELQDEVVDFLASGPSPEEIVAFKPSQKSMRRVSTLLDKNADNTLSTREKAELDEVESLDYLMMSVKARARAKLQAREIGASA